MVPVVSLRAIVDELTIANDERRSYLQKETGEIRGLGLEELSAAEEEEELTGYPEWQQKLIQEAGEVLASDLWLELPTAFDIHEYSIMEDFCRRVEDNDLSDELLYQIRGSGAFGRFKHAIYRYHIAEAWYRYRDQALAEIAAQWLDAHDIAYVGDVDVPRSQDTEE